MTSDGVNSMIAVGVNKDVLEAEITCYHRFKDQPMDHVRELRGLSVDEQCEAIFNHLAQFVRYKLDPPNVQYIKSPARLLADGCGDCKSLTMYIVCCLHCLGISHIIRFVAFDNDTQYTHVYPVALDGTREIILDACEKDEDGYPLYDYARPYTKKKDYTFYE